jgi:hypothetical protein
MVKRCKYKTECDQYDGDSCFENTECGLKDNYETDYPKIVTKKGKVYKGVKLIKQGEKNVRNNRRKRKSNL